MFFVCCIQHKEKMLWPIKEIFSWQFDGFNRVFTFQRLGNTATPYFYSFSNTQPVITYNDKIISHAQTIKTPPRLPLLQSIPFQYLASLDIMKPLIIDQNHPSEIIFRDHWYDSVTRCCPVILHGDTQYTDHGIRALDVNRRVISPLTRSTEH